MAKFRILLVVVQGKSVRKNQDGVPCPALSYLILPQLQNKIRGGIGLPGCLTSYSFFWLHLICVTLTDFTNVQRKRYHNKRTYN